MAKNTNRARNSDVVFLFSQQIVGRVPEAPSHLTAIDHPSHDSAVSEDTLRRLILRIPLIPPRQRGAKKLRSPLIADQKIRTLNEKRRG